MNDLFGPGSDKSGPKPPAKPAKADNDKRLPLDNPAFAADQKFPAGADPKNPANYERYIGKQYAPDLIDEQAMQFVRDNKDRPFFLYWPTTVPHLALQVPEDSLAEYLGKFLEEPYVGQSGYLPHRAPLIWDKIENLRTALDAIKLANDGEFS